MGEPMKHAWVAFTTVSGNTRNMGSLSKILLCLPLVLSVPSAEELLLL